MFGIKDRKDRKDRNETVSQENVQESLNLDSSELLFNELSEDLAEIINGGGSCHFQVMQA